MPTVIDAAWPRTPIDRFILDRLEAAGLHPSREASRVEWLRRVSFDLIGLPPTPEETAGFLADVRPDAFERVVERLLGSPRYGERWAQHWLDVVRYADTHGFEVNTERPNAWPYRDYVIGALNQDLPYDRFVREQIAGDSLGSDAATGFLVTASVLLPGQIGADDVSKRLARQDSLDEIVVNTGQTFLGLSIGCARCHDHKFDPILSRDYYAMQAFFAGVEYEEREIRNPAKEETRLEVAKIRGDLARLELNPGLSPAAAREVETLGQRRKELESRLKLLSASQRAFAGVFRRPDPIRRLRRGDPEQPMEAVAPGIPAVLGTLTLSEDTPEAERRLALANWLARPEHPLTSRVLVNRIWQGHFGTGIVETPSDFGHNGARPSHPELLDWLATELIRRGGSLKAMHRLIVLSATYRQSVGEARSMAAGLKLDSGDRLLWRFPSRRLESEVIRDSMVSVSGRLDFKAGGRGFDLFNQRGGLSGFKPVESYQGEGLRRMIYAHKVRREREAVFGAFDCPDAGQSTARRRESTTPLQALNLFNSRFTLEASEALAKRVRTESGATPKLQVRAAYRLALSRAPDADEETEAVTFLQTHGLTGFCRALFNCNEFLVYP